MELAFFTSKVQVSLLLRRSLLLPKTQLIFTGGWGGEGSSDRKQLDGTQIRKLKRKPLQDNKSKKIKKNNTVKKETITT